MSTHTDVRQYKTYLHLIDEVNTAVAHISDRIDESQDGNEQLALIAHKDALQTQSNKMVDAQIVYMTTHSPAASTAISRLRKTVASAKRTNRNLKKLANALGAASKMVGIATRFVNLLS